MGDINQTGDYSVTGGINQTGDFTSSGTIEGGTLTDGTATITGGALSGITNIAGGVVFNEDGADVDFRIESSGNANMFTIDAGNDHIGIGRNSTEGIMNVSSAGATTRNQLYYECYSADNGYYSQLIFRKSASNTMGSRVDTASDEVLGSIDAYGVVSTNISGGARIVFEQDGAGDTNRIPVNTVFENNDGSMSSSNIETLRLGADEVVINEGGVDLDFRVESDGNANMLFVDGGEDKVYIGHNANVYSFASFEVNNVTTYTSQAINCFSDSVTHSPFLQFTKSHVDTLGTLTTTIDGETIGAIVFRGIDSGSNIDSGASIQAIQDGAAGIKVPTNLILTTYSSTAENSNQLVLHNDGKVGIGTDSPSYILQVNGGISGLEKSADPAEPAEGEYVIWMSDGTGKGDDGDVLIASKAGGTTKYATLFDHSSGSAW
jgi:hypothetical protein